MEFLKMRRVVRDDGWFYSYQLLVCLSPYSLETILMSICLSKKKYINPLEIYIAKKRTRKEIYELKSTREAVLTKLLVNTILCK